MDKLKACGLNDLKNQRAFKIDPVHDKLRKSGEGRLTEEAKKSLFDASKH